jgi:hypothetical protein
MDLREKIIAHICKVTGNKNADLWTLKFDENDANANLSNLSSQYIEGIKIRTNEEVAKDVNYLIKNSRKYF